MSTFYLPDLGEGLPDAEIVEWLVKEGDEIKLDQPMVSMETAKAVVEVPSPFTGRIVKLHGQAGDIIQTGAALADFEVAGSSADAAPAAANKAPDKSADHTPAVTASEDQGTVVGAVQSGGGVLREHTTSVGGVRMSPAVRALARKLKVDPAQCVGTGADGVVTAADVKRAAAEGPALGGTTASRPASKPAPAPAPVTPPSGEWEPLRGTRRTMARVMTESHRSIVPTTLMDDADIHQWAPQEDITGRLIRAMVKASHVEPGLNAWFDGEQNLRMVHKRMHLGMAVDTADGLMVAALRNVDQLDRSGLREQINRLRDNAIQRSIPPEDLKDYTIILSNFGKFAGRYATPVITPPCVAIVAAGKLRHEVVPVLGGVEVHRMIPLSLTFDHRACTGGEAARFMAAMLADLGRAQ
jgi:pyruvate dehydrogenase E2 component (dihydrolipoamide acetyltransferase)